MTRRRNKERDFLAIGRSEKKETYKKHNTHSLLATAAITAAAVGLLAGSTTNTHEQPTRQERLSADQTNSQTETQRQESYSFDYEDRRTAAEFIDNNHLVEQVSRVALGSHYQMEVSEQGVNDSSSVLSYSANNYNHLMGEDGVMCTPDDEDAAPMAINATLYLSGEGSMSIRVENPRTPATCKNAASEESVSVAFKIKHNGAKDFNLQDTLQEVVNQPGSVDISTIAVQGVGPNENLRVTNSTAVGTDLSGDGFKVERNGRDVEVRSLDEARRYADDVTRGATTTIQRLS